MNVPRGSLAVMNARHVALDSLELFPTPPWATRALFEHVLVAGAVKGDRVWEPAAGFDHMSDVLDEYFGDVVRSDVFDYGRGHRIGSFVGEGPDVIPAPADVDWIVTNPPFAHASRFAQRALSMDLCGFALLQRSNWAESEGRYIDLFSRNAPSIVAQFAERVPMVEGRWDPDASSATSYAWFVWLERGRTWSQLQWIPPICRSTLTRADDHERFAMRGLIDLAPVPLFDGVSA